MLQLLEERGSIDVSLHSGERATRANEVAYEGYRRASVVFKKKNSLGTEFANEDQVPFARAGGACFVGSFGLWAGDDLLVSGSINNIHGVNGWEFPPGKLQLSIKC